MSVIALRDCICDILEVRIYHEKLLLNKNVNSNEKCLFMFFCRVFLIVTNLLLILFILWKTFHATLTILCDNKNIESGQLIVYQLAFLRFLRLLILINIIHCLGHSIQILCVEVIYNQFVRPIAQMVSLFFETKFFMWKFGYMKGCLKRT